ncbi:MAG TPA: AbrB family transcriptional regulator [Rhodospirillaceae bacterium]|nr:AbrB family transcriptional regulator [Rhodospirillaceae bacterium]
MKTLPPALRRAAAIIGGLLVALAGSLLWRSFGLPLPWLVGSLLCVAAARILGLPLSAPPAARQAGQWVIGTNIGLYFSSQVVGQLLSHAGLIAAMAAVSVLLGALGAAIMVRLAIADRPTAFFASMPGGASEMANIADRWRAAVDLVALAHALRVTLVVVVVPLAMALSGSHGSDASANPHRDLIWGNLPVMAAAGLAGMAGFRVLRLPNPWVLGTLAGVGALALGGGPLSALPPWMAAGGQLLIGISLGNHFGPGFLRRAPVFVFASTVNSLVYLAVTGLLAWLLAPMTGVGMASLALSFSPGGIAEMSITASQLNLGVPLVVASHVARVIALMLLASPAFRVFSRLFKEGKP